jgi:sec-independent protein translocase protein TatA
MPVGIPELLIVLAIVLLIFGPKRLPSLGRSLGGGIRNFKDSIAKRHEEGELEAGQAPPSDDAEPLTGEVVRDRRP